MYLEKVKSLIAKFLMESFILVLSEMLLEEVTVLEFKNKLANNQFMEELPLMLDGNYTLEEFIKENTVVVTPKILTTPSP